MRPACPRRSSRSASRTPSSPATGSSTRRSARWTRGLRPEPSERLGVRLERHERVLEAFERARPSGLVDDAAGIRDDDRDEAEIAAVPDGGLDPDLEDGSHDDERDDAAVAEHQLERRADEGGHREL